MFLSSDQSFQKRFKLLPEIALIIRNLSEVTNEQSMSKLLSILSIECCMQILTQCKDKYQTNSIAVEHAFNAIQNITQFYDKDDD